MGSLPMADKPHFSRYLLWFLKPVLIFSDFCWVFEVFCNSWNFSGSSFGISGPFLCQIWVWEAFFWILGVFLLLGDFWLSFHDNCTARRENYTVCPDNFGAFCGVFAHVLKGDVAPGFVVTTYVLLVRYLPMCWNADKAPWSVATILVPFVGYLPTC